MHILEILVVGASLDDQNLLAGNFGEAACHYTTSSSATNAKRVALLEEIKSRSRSLGVCLPANDKIVNKIVGLFNRLHGVSSAW